MAEDIGTGPLPRSMVHFAFLILVLAADFISARPHCCCPAIRPHSGFRVP